MDWIEVNGAALRFDIQGGGTKPLVLIHEMGGTLESWSDVVPLVLPGRRVLRYDTRGAGLSEKILGEVSLDTMTADLAALLDALGLTGRVALAGIAVGAAIGIHFAARYPARTSALIAMAPATGMAPERRAAALAGVARMEKEGVRPGTDPMLAQTYPAQLRGDTKRYERLRNQRLGNDPASYAAIYRMLAGLDMAASLAAVRCPALVLGGEYDGLRPPPGCEAVARAIPGAKFRAVASGHFMATQTPDIVAEAINGFLGEVGG